MWILRAPPGEHYPRTAVHSHHVIQLTLALRGQVEFEGDAGPVSGVALAVAPDARHSFRGTGLVAHVFVAPDGQAGREIARGLFSEDAIAQLPTELVDDLRARLCERFEDPACSDEELRALGREVIDRVSGQRAPAPRADPRITRVIAWMTARLEEAITLTDVASVAGLSAGRTRHLFVEQTGLSFRTYLLWLRLVRALELFATGASLTEAAHRAGFADSAHLSRTFRRMFGIAAATLRVT